MSIGTVAREWWMEWCHPTEGDPGARARLRRARSAVEALTIPAAIHLARRIGFGGEARDARLTTAVNLARVLAHVREQSNSESARIMQRVGWTTFPGRAAEGSDGEGPRLSETRFRRLLLLNRGEELVIGFTRLVALAEADRRHQLVNRARADQPLNVAALAEDFFWWNDAVKRRWAFEYYAAGVAAPSPSTSTTETSGI